MEAVVLEDSPLAEYLEGMKVPRIYIFYQAVDFLIQARAEKMGKMIQTVKERSHFRVLRVRPLRHEADQRFD
jgi:hypothetical protein